MSKTLGGFAFIRNGLKFDYSMRESVESMLEFCDEVCICYVESDDDTLRVLEEIKEKDNRLHIVHQSNRDWERERGKEKLSYFQNIAAAELDTDYQYLQQMDEITHESCYDSIRQAMKTAQEAFLITRINLWGSPYTQLNVPQHRKPCSTEVIRLSKRGYKSYDDGESINAQCVDWFLKSIRMFHVGYVREKTIHPDKIREMQGNIFVCGVDEKLNGMDVFDSTKWFTDADLKPIDEALPRIIQKWAMERM